MKLIDGATTAAYFKGYGNAIDYETWEFRQFPIRFQIFLETL